MKPIASPFIWFGGKSRGELRRRFELFLSTCSREGVVSIRDLRELLKSLGINQAGQ